MNKIALSNIHSSPLIASLSGEVSGPTTEQKSVEQSGEAGKFLEILQAQMETKVAPEQEFVATNAQLKTKNEAGLKSELIKNKEIILPAIVGPQKQAFKEASAIDLVTVSDENLVEPKKNSLASVTKNEVLENKLSLDIKNDDEGLATNQNELVMPLSNVEAPIANLKSEAPKAFNKSEVLETKASNPLEVLGIKQGKVMMPIVQEKIVSDFKTPKNHEAIDSFDSIKIEKATSTPGPASIDHGQTDLLLTDRKKFFIDNRTNEALSKFQQNAPIERKSFFAKMEKMENVPALSSMPEVAIKESEKNNEGEHNIKSAPEQSPEGLIENKKQIDVVAEAQIRPTPLNTKNTVREQVFEKVSQYIEQNNLRTSESVDISVGDRSIGDFQLKVFRPQGQRELEIQVSTSTQEGKTFFGEHEKGILQHLKRSGIEVGEFKITGPEIDRLSFKNLGESNQQGFEQNKGQNGQGERLFERQHKDQGQERRRELWDFYKERMLS